MFGERVEPVPIQSEVAALVQGAFASALVSSWLLRARCVFCFPCVCVCGGFCSEVLAPPTHITHMKRGVTSLLLLNLPVYPACGSIFMLYAGAFFGAETHESRQTHRQTDTANKEQSQREGLSGALGQASLVKAEMPTRDLMRDSIMWRTAAVVVAFALALALGVAVAIVDDGAVATRLNMLYRAQSSESFSSFGSTFLVPEVGHGNRAWAGYRHLQCFRMLALPSWCPHNCRLPRCGHNPTEESYFGAPRQETWREPESTTIRSFGKS